MSRARRRPHRYRRNADFDNHDRWLVSYADFITLLFAFFVVMYAISSVSESKYRVVAEALVGAFARDGQPTAAGPGGPAAGHPVPALASVDPREIRAERVRRQLRGIADDVSRVLAALVQKGQVRVTDGANGVAVEINASVLFEPGQAKLGGQAADLLRAVGQVLAGLPNPVRVEGHTDDTPIRTEVFPSNWELSAARAASVVRLFAEQGVDPRRQSAVGYAQFRPREPNVDAESRARNRRVTIEIVPVEPEEIAAAAGGAAPQP